VLDPAVIVYCGYIGGSDQDYGLGIAVDAAGNAYVTGATWSTEATFPVVVGPDLTLNGFWDAFVAKVSSDGTSLVYCGYIGGSDSDEGWSIAVDGAGSAYVTGYTYSTEATFPVVGGPDLTHNGDSDVFVAKVRSDGTSLVYCGYIGGSGNDWGYVIAVDAAGNAYVTGWTDSAEATFPVAGGPDLTFNGGDAFVAKVSGEGGPTPQVKVVSEYSGPVADAAIYRNGAWVGATGTDGLLSIPDLRAGDKLAATSRITETVTSRGSHSQDSTQNWAYRVYLTSVAIDNQGNPALHTVAIPNTTQVGANRDPKKHPHRFQHRGLGRVGCQRELPGRAAAGL
jgi:hypothetical protein